jgi:hypothetical protein
MVFVPAPVSTSRNVPPGTSVESSPLAGIAAL